MSWLAVAIGVGIAVVFLTLVFLILWLFPDDGQRPKPVRPRYDRTLYSYQLRGDVEEPEGEETYQQVVTLRSCLKRRQENDTPRSTVPGMEPPADHVDDPHTIVLEIDGEAVHTNVHIKGEDSISATLEFDGPDRSIPHRRNGNINEISKAGSLHEFLMGLHKEFGPIASFWWGKQYTISISTPELFRQHQHIFDRPVEQFMMFEPFITRHSIQYANGADGKLRRQAYDKVFSHDNLGIYYSRLQKVADEIASKWDYAEADDHFPLGEHMFLYSVKAALIGLMGDTFRDDKEAMTLKHCYDVAWEDMEQRLTNPVLPKEDSAQAQNFKKAISSIKELVSRAVKERESHGRESRDFLLIDAIIGHHTDDEERRFGDAITYMVGGFHTTGNLLTWCIYFLCMHVECQERLYREISTVLGPKEPVTHLSFGRLTYLRQVLDETLRCAVVAPWAARYSEDDIVLGGHKIFAGTPVIHALGVSLMDEDIWPAPTVFDPDRFSERRSKGRPSLAFSPFGFAGHRKCPGYRFAYVEAGIMLVTALQRFHFLLVPGQEVKPQYGLVTHPKEEIWFRVTRRS